MIGYNKRVLVRLSDSVPLTPEQMNEALGHGLAWKKYRSPGLETTVEELERLASHGLASRTAEGWMLTTAGLAEWNRLETLFDNSGGHGDYGF